MTCSAQNTCSECGAVVVCGLAEHDRDQEHYAGCVARVDGDYCHNITAWKGNAFEIKDSSSREMIRVQENGDITVYGWWMSDYDKKEILRSLTDYVERAVKGR